MVLVGCFSNDSASTGDTANNTESNLEDAEKDPRADRPDELVMSIVPSEDVVTITNRYEPFIEYLSNRLGVPVKIYVASDYTASVEALRNGHTHIGTWGTFSYVLANQRAGAEAFAVTLLDGEPVYHANYITLEGSGIESVKDLEGKTMAWVNPASASGYIFPKADIMSKVGLTFDTVDDFFANTVFTGGHDATWISVLNGDVDAGVTSSGNYFERRLEQFKGLPNIDKIKVFETTRDIARSPTTYAANLPEDLKKEIKDAFFDVLNHAELTEFLEAQGLTEGYIEVDDSM